MRPRTLPALDGLRGVAALLVLLTHTAFLTGTYAQGWMGAALAHFDIGVAIFFVLSGFLLMRPWAAADEAAPELRRYARHRTARILPAYWAALAVVALTTARGAGPGPITSNALLLQTYTGDLLPGFTQTWSVCAEVAFYALLPLLAPWVRARGQGLSTLIRLIVLGGVGLGWVALVATGAISWPWASTWLPGHLLWFAVGMGLAILEGTPRSDTRAARALRDLAGFPATTVLLAGAVFWLVASSLGGPVGLGPSTAWQTVAKESLYAVVAGLLVLAAGFAPAGGAAERLLGGRSGRWAGRVSYAVFLWHLVVLAGVMSLLGIPEFTGNFAIVSSLTLVGSIAVGLASWVIIERPVLARVGARRL